MAEEILFTQEGYDELVKKLDYLIGVRRAEVTEQMQVARITHRLKQQNLSSQKHRVLS